MLRVNLFILLAQAGEVQRVSEFLNDGMDIEATDSDGHTALQAACHRHQQNNYAMIDFLLSKGANMMVVDTLNNNLLHLLLTHGRRESVQSAMRIITSLPSDMTEFFDMKNSYNETPLFIAATWGVAQVA